MANKGMVDQPLLGSSKNVIHRAVVSIRGSRSELKKQTRVVLSLESHLQKKLDERINNLNVRCFAVIPRIKVDIVSNPVEEYANDNLRIIISTTTKNIFSLSDTAYEASEISHLLEIDFTSESNFSFRRNINAVYKTNNIETVQTMIVDLMSDIAMYHSWKIDSGENSLNFRRNISNEKAAFAAQNNLFEPNGASKLWRGNPDYFSFAFACHKNGDFDYDLYENIWVQFVQPHILEESLEAKTVQEQVQFFAKVGQLSIRKVQRLFDEYPEPGPYILMMMAKKPRRHDEARRIIEYFGRTRWKNGTIKIVPISKYNDVARFYPAV